MNQCGLIRGGGKEMTKFEWRMTNEERLIIRHSEFEFRHSPVGGPPEGGTPTWAVWQVGRKGRISSVNRMDNYVSVCEKHVINSLIHPTE